MSRFFGEDAPDATPAEAVPLNYPRPLVAAAEVMDLSKRHESLMRKNAAWQDAAWGYYDQVGELKYAFNLIGQIVSRAMLFVALVEDSSEVPVDSKSFLETMPKTGEDGGHKVRDACKVAQEGLEKLAEGGQAELLRLFAMNLSIPGECYLVDDGSKMTVASISELRPGTPYRLDRSRTVTTGMGSAQNSTGKALEKNAYCARIWRSHPRWYNEADSSMLGVLDQVEKVVLFDQVMRTISRQRLNAGVIYVPAGLVPANGKSLEEALNEATLSPVEDEAAAANVTPLLLTGPPELGDSIKRIELARPLDETLIAASDAAIDRMLAGLDIPKNIVSGLADTRYSNALIIDDSLYKAHVEPLVLLICDALTSAYLRPYLRAHGVEESIAKRLVVWYNPSQIVTRPDRSQAANEGYDRYLLSGEAWRRARGYSDLDKPSEDELVHRLALEKVQIPQEVGVQMIESLNPSFFAAKRAEGQAEAGMPPEVSQMLQPNNPPPIMDSPPTETPAQTNAESGGQNTGNGFQPARDREMPRT